MASNLAARQIIAAVFVLIWCSRLGSMLFLRILRTGDDKRFDKLKKNPWIFAVPWFMQAVWVFVTAWPGKQLMILSRIHLSFSIQLNNICRF